MNARLMNLVTFASVAFAFAWTIAYPLLTVYPAVDMEVFLRATSGVDMTGYFYAPWGLHLYQLLLPMPHEAIHIAVGLLTVVGMLLACKAFGGSIPMVMTSYALTTSLFFGQPDGLWAIGLVLMYWGVKRKSTSLAVIGWLIAMPKYYIGLPLGVGILWCFADIKQARQIIIFTVLGLVASLFIYGPWPLRILERWAASPPGDVYAIDTWQYIGPAGLILWLPIFLTRNRSFSGFTAAWALSVPYLQVHGLLYVLMTSGPIGLLAHVGYLMGFGEDIIILQIFSLAVYIMAFRPWWQQHQAGRKLKTETAPSGADNEAVAPSLSAH